MTTLVLPFAGARQIFAHGGEDDGAQKPTTTTGDKGTITRAARLGEYELTLEHQFLEPDTATSGKLFVTKFKTNEAVDNAAAKIEFESADGSVTEAAVEKTEIAGSYNVKISALPQGVFTVRAKLTYGGETDTATFYGVEVASAAATESTLSRAQTALIDFVFVLVLALLGGLIYFVWHFADDGESLKEKTVSACAG